MQNEKARIDHQRRANEDAAKLERIRIDSAMKKVEDHMSDEQKRLRKESDSRIDQMVRTHIANAVGAQKALSPCD